MSVGIQRWGTDLIRFRQRIGFDLREPNGFSRYLIAAYSDHADEDDRRLASWSSIKRDYNISKQDERKAFAVWLRSLAPDGLVCARGLHSLSFMPGENIYKIITLGRREGVAYYSMNIEKSIADFATRSARKIGGTVSASMAKVAATLDEKALGTVGTLTGYTKEDWDYNVADWAREGDPPPWHTLSPKTKHALKISQCPVVVVARVSKDDVEGPGNDSESGDTNEAEIYVMACEPKCIEHIFVASAIHRLGRPVQASVRSHYGLDYHNVLTYDDDDWGKISLTLHPSVHLGRRVRNLPPEWVWYEVST